MNSRFQHISKETADLLDWYDTNARALAWRVEPEKSRAGKLPDPYRVWLSEIMLQQTQVKTVGEYFEKFTTLWPRIEDLAGAELEDILKAWAGLGYYSRARNLKKCADIIWHEFGGVFPSGIDELKKLPGIGDYTSAAIAAIAFGRNVPVVDGNVERVTARVNLIETPLPRTKAEIHSLVERLVPETRPGDFAQAMMDLGATICTPKNPSCISCPWQDNCRAFAQSRQREFPVKAVKKSMPVRTSAAFVAMTAHGEILLRKRSDKGMLAGMSEVPSGEWSASTNGDSSVEGAPISANWQYCGKVRHSFTHFYIEMKVYFCLLNSRAKVDGWWVHRDIVNEEALPTLMKKIVALALSSQKEVA